jgi:hypothetical protein
MLIILQAAEDRDVNGDVNYLSGKMGSVYLVTLGAVIG